MPCNSLFRVECAGRQQDVGRGHIDVGSEHQAASSPWTAGDML
jgi:hypothetical protein